jgi:pre-mRNA-splicing factor ATP-dependent RNA helicase DHX15/PRP43
MMTHDILVREALSSPLLSEYNVIVVDEAQERTLSTDLLLIILKDILKKRIDLKIVVLSSSNEAISFVEHFDQCGIPGVMVVPTITYPVEILYSDEEPRDPVTAAVDKAVEVHLTEPEGDVLLFLPREMIQQACDLIDNALKLMSEKGLCEPFLVVPLFSDLPLEMQDQIFEPAPRLWRVGIRQIRKIIVSTHIAECSLVMDGISYVIDSGIFGHKYYDPVTNLGTVMISEINRKSAIQRSLCAGRARPGRCFRLYNQATFIQLDPEILPEILLCDLASMVLTLMKLGITNLVTVDYLDCPAPQVVINALDALYQLGALDDEARLTIFGELLSQLPLDPQLATALLKSQEFHCANEIISISAMLSGISMCYVVFYTVQLPLLCA